MSEIVETYQAEQEIKQPEESRFAFGTVVSISPDGLTIKFDGEDVASSKKFIRNSAINFAVGDRVVLEKIDGQYIVCFPVALNGGFDYVKLSDLAAYATKEELLDYATKEELLDYATKEELDDYAKRTDLNAYVKSNDIVDNLTSTDRTVPLSANQGRALKALIPDLTEHTTTRNTGTIAAGGSTSSYFVATGMKFLTGFYTNSADIIVTAYSSGQYIYWRAYNIGSSSAYATMTFSYIT